jgi:hypothetical protein
LGRYTCAVWGLLLFPYPTSDPELELLPVTAGEEEGHVPLDDEPIMAVPHLPVAVTDAPGGALPYHLPAIGTDLQAVAVVLCIVLVPHETEKCHVHRCHPKLEGLEVKAKVLPETVKYLHTRVSTHPILVCSILGKYSTKRRENKIHTVSIQVAFSTSRGFDLTYLWLNVQPLCISTL